jgi:hypothetical protein
MRPFEAADAESLRETIDVGANLIDWAKALTAASGPAWTGLIEGRVAGCGGMVILWPGTAEAWSVFADWTAAYRRTMLCTCRRAMDSAAREYGLRRVQATLRTDLPDSWLRHLGFTREGLMRRYCVDGCDAAIWARLYDV